MSAYIIWLIFGVFCFLVEIFAISGVGFLFAGLAALTVGCAIGIFPELDLLMQIVIFLASGALWAILLWKPLQKFRGNSSEQSVYNNIIGEAAYISESGLKKGQIGEASWSGTIMKAKLADDSAVEEISGGAKVVIVGVTGNTLLVRS